MENYASNMQSPKTAEPNLENSLKILRSTLSELSAAAHRIADKLGGSRPETTGPVAGGQPEQSSLVATIRDLQREADYIRNHLNRAENYLG